MRSIFSTVTLAGALLLLFTQAATAQEGEGVETFGDWGYKCDPGKEGRQQLCYAFQNVTRKEGGQLVLGVRIAFREDQKDPLIVATVPLGSLLPPGAALMLDGVEPVKMDYFLCAAEGCTTVATPLPPAMVSAMKAGERAVVRVAAPNNQVVGLPLSLMGFTKAMNRLTQ
jgi:invasion protein IalB